MLLVGKRHAFILTHPPTSFPKSTLMTFASSVSQVTSTILQIFAEEVLGYRNISVLHVGNSTVAFDTNFLYSQLSNCNESL